MKVKMTRHIYNSQIINSHNLINREYLTKKKSQKMKIVSTIPTVTTQTVNEKQIKKAVIVKLSSDGNLTI